MTTKETDLYQFPCKFPIKVITHRKQDIETIILEIISKHAPDVKKSAVNIRPSKTNKYWAITVTIVATSKAQLDKIYLQLNGHDDVVMTL